MQSPWFSSVDSFFLRHWGQSTTKNSTGKQVNLWVSKVWSKEGWSLEQKRWSIAGRRQKMVRSGAGEGEIQWSDEQSQVLQLSLAWSCQLAQKHVLRVERTQLCHWHRLSSPLERPFKEGHRGTAVPKVSQSSKGLDLQSTSSLDSSAARHWDYASNFLFLVLRGLMIFWQKGRFTEEWRREMWEV